MNKNLRSLIGVFFRFSVIGLYLNLLGFSQVPAVPKLQQKLPVTRWEEKAPGCTSSPSSPDGKYTYGISSGDLSVVLAVDGRELQVIRHRIEPILGVRLTIRYNGLNSVDLTTEEISLQFPKHFGVIQPVLDPDDYVQKIQSDEDSLNDENRRFVEKHPDQKAVREARLQEYEESATKLIEFLARSSLRPARLDRSHQEASGWVFFSTQNKWLGGWKQQDEFIVRVPVDGKLFEFPFKLPPQQDELLLRKRD